ncbi:MAG: dihydropteridine reductase [Anaeroplasmataceae bacterium]
MKDLDKVYAESIAKEYSAKTDSKVMALRKLDAKVKKPAYIFAFTFGIISALILGVGMCLAMKVIGPGSTLFFVLGIVIGLIGIGCCGLNYLLFNKILNSRKEKYSFEIIELAKDITNE